MTTNVERTTAESSRSQNADRTLNHRRMAVGISLASIAAIHVLDLPGKLAETPYLGVGYIMIIIASLVLMERLFVVGSRRDFIAAAALSGAVIVGFVINRTVGMPGAMDDIGNWLEPLGLLSILVEGFVVWQALAAIVSRSGRLVSAA
ncbi:hypothetical protein GY21_13095 [Cryobacterium roopkundense]|uniref:Uncharacterized protein n=1 Tax=Cryobacterium roopkundense TaxID=1001240 RepID=A0A099J2Y9_9MICO|nr:twin-arginine translocation signal domain-containing protein [Cryobacterium roopkundense]KGJ72794.1 hypothetical protein GY21_13095 [Cryobacterium roopkundense]MBB5639460.1 hypothetical protein [Cryobacterium roopkundense]